MVLAALSLAICSGTGARGEGLEDCAQYTLNNQHKHRNGGTYYLCPVDTKRFPKALCNDGTKAVFQLQQAQTRSKWVIWLEGGYQCVNQATCESRAAAKRTLVSSKGWKPGVGQGVLSHDPAVNPALADANSVIVHYCSSDAWSGGRLATAKGGFNPSNPATWDFEGRTIAEAVIGTLKESASGFGLGYASQVVLGGGSAGAAGVTYVANDLVPLLPHAAQPLLVSDAGFVVDVGKFDGALASPYEDTTPPTPFWIVINQGRTLWQGHGDSFCDARARTPQQHTACYDTSVLLQQHYVTLPTFVAESQLDTPEVSEQLCPGRNGNCAVPTRSSGALGVYTNNYASQTAHLVSGQGASDLPYTAYSPDIYVHTMLDLDGTFLADLLQPGNLSPKAAFNAWYANPHQAGHAHLGTRPGIQKPINYQQ